MYIIVKTIKTFNMWKEKVKLDLFLKDMVNAKKKKK